MADHHAPRRASAHVERDHSGFDLAGFVSSGSSGGVVAGNIGAGAAAAPTSAAERRRSTSFLPSPSSSHGPEMVSDEDNELFLSDEFRMYCYKVRVFGERRKAISASRRRMRDVFFSFFVAGSPSPPLSLFPFSILAPTEEGEV
jgi:hypothetical protein